jgi:hypothetical protein
MSAETLIFGRAAADMAALLRVQVTYCSPAVECQDGCCGSIPEQSIRLTPDSSVLSDIFSAGNGQRVTLDLAEVVGAISDRVRIEAMLLLQGGQIHQATALLAGVERVLAGYRGPT